MAGPSFNNEVNLAEISLAIQQLLVADVATTWTRARVDLDSPPAGFQHLGAVVEDTPSFNVTKTKFQLFTGIPATIQFEAVIGLEGTFEVSLHSQSWRKVQFAFGNVSAVSSTTVVATIVSVIDRETITFAATTDLESLPVGRQFAFAGVEADFDKADTAETRVASVLADGVTIKLSPTPIKTPAIDDVVGIYQFVDAFVGTRLTREHHLLAVADFIDGSQVVHEFFKVSPGEEFTEAINPTENARIPLSFNAFGVSRTDVPGVSTSELVIARRAYFPTLS